MAVSGLQICTAVLLRKCTEAQAEILHVEAMLCLLEAMTHVLFLSLSSCTIKALVYPATLRPCDLCT